MKAPQRRYLESYVRVLADRLGLKDWEIKVDPIVPKDVEWEAEVNISDYQRRASVTFAACFFEALPAQQRYVVTHELIHCHLDAAWAFANKVVEEEVDGADVFETAFTAMMESAVDGIASAVAPLMPPIRLKALPAEEARR